MCVSTTIFGDTGSILVCKVHRHAQSAQRRATRAHAPAHAHLQQHAHPCRRRAAPCQQQHPADGLVQAVGGVQRPQVGTGGLGRGLKQTGAAIGRDAKPDSRVEANGGGHTVVLDGRPGRGEQV